MNNKLSGHALENYKKIKNLIDSGLDDDQLDDALMNMYFNNDFKGGPEMLKQTYKSICQDFDVEINGFRTVLGLNNEIPGEDIIKDDPSPSSTEE